MATNSTDVPYFKITDTSMDGLYTWTGLAVLFTILGGILYEVLRRTKVMHRILYTRTYTNTRETPIFPAGFFGWVPLAYATKEVWFIENVGLDAVMFLRFLHSSFYFFGALLLLVFPVLTAVHYVAPNGIVDSKLISNSGSNFQLAQVTLNQFSIINIPNGSNLFYIHVVYAYLITAGLFGLFYYGYNEFSKIAVNYLKETTTLTKKSTPWRRGEILQQRTILIQNLPDHLQSDERLREFIESLGIGEVKSVTLDRIASVASHEISKKRDKILGKLEHAYMDWGDAIIIQKQATLNLTRMDKLKIYFGLRLQPSTELIQLTPNEIWACRPAFKTALKYHSGTLNSDTVDAIDYYTEALNLLTAQLRQKRLIAMEPSLYKQINQNLCSSTGFVTFKTQRAAQIAAQTLLYLSSNPTTFKVTNAPAPQDINWRSIGRARTKKLIARHLVTALCVVLCLFIAFPTSLIASVLNTESLARIGFLKDVLIRLADTPRARVIVETIIPQIIVGLMNYSIIPLVLQVLSSLQGYVSNSRQEMAMMSKYFAFLFFNVFFVFTLAAAFWDLISNFIKNPLAFLEQLPTTLPAGAPFFINYIISNIILYSVELCRPSSAIYGIIGEKFFVKTPRELYQNSLFSSYLDYGWLYPQHVLAFIIILCYSLIAPIILIPGCVYFGIGILVYKNQLMYVYVKEWESYGQHWILAFNRALVGVAVFQITLTGILLLKEMIVPAVMIALLVPCTFLFYRHCQKTFEYKTRQVPLDQLPLNQAPVSLPGSLESGLNITQSTHNTLNEPIERRLSFMEDIVYTPEEHAEERYLTSYMNPIFSKAIQRPWIPRDYALMFSDVNKKRRLSFNQEELNIQSPIAFRSQSLNLDRYASDDIIQVVESEEVPGVEVVDKSSLNGSVFEAVNGRSKVGSTERLISKRESI